ncbi:hypothetical protein CRENBAI_022856 [Crenichthys baileyi]|uniref:Uncharacterized protein n=1 Tax=Crenichthys baileyi TaxID=28760 RepID=A0AAV9RI90_9TELE
MLHPSPCLHFGPHQNHTVTAGTSQTDQADRATELKKWIEQQETTLRFLYGEEVEILHSPLLLEEMEECFGETDWAAMDFVPARSRSSLVRASSSQALHLSSSSRARLTSASSSRISGWIFLLPRTMSSPKGSRHREGSEGPPARLPCGCLPRSLKAVAQRPLLVSGRRCNLQFRHGFRRVEGD